MRFLLDISHSPILLAQCKAFHPLEDISKEIETMLKIDSTKDFKIHISLPYSYIEPISKQFPSNELNLGAEQILSIEEGSFTASIAANLLKEANAKFVLIGTPEERASFPAGSQLLVNKIKKALEDHIQPFICVGDTLQEHQDKMTKQILISQLKDCLSGFSSEDLQKIFIVYNAEWISRTPWEAESPELKEAYTLFREAVKEALEPEIISHHQLIVAIPAYSQDVNQLIKILNTDTNPFVGYSLGILSSSAEFLQPLVTLSNDTPSTKNPDETLPTS